MTEEEYREFQSRIANGEEFNFLYKEKEYWISHGQNGESFLSTSSGRHHYYQKFDDTEELFEEGTIEGIKLSDIYPELKWR
ncbi:hypothetical protein [Lysinibacillus piscis]|uniref:Uncharacterized protein n=1 Tax=Lysinibacillus piscis TaxID=2518931 RepID=A0ABQ5NJG5_9BACI|nr:hypothetical protein [Lysinibacillus sp. KH24]GLC88510.1 hypothetical protein LYSBPC_16370 [Lysinibacillus sp. KH24]